MDCPRRHHVRFLFSALLLVLLSVAPAFAGQANVFIYHRFGESRYPSTNIAIDAFKAHLEVLRSEEVEVISLGRLVTLMKSGASLDKHYAVLTVDDAYASFLTGAMPLLRQYRFPVTLFVNTDAVGGRGYLNWQQLKELAGEGVEIGNHTASHPHLVNRRPVESDRDWASRIAGELNHSQQVLTTHLELKPNLFAYPYGEYSPAVQDLVRQAGFSAAIAQQSGVVSADADLYALPRFPMGGPYTDIKQFRSKLFMRPLPIELTSRVSTLVDSGNNPPTLELRIDSSKVDLGRLACYVSGQEQALIEEVQTEPGLYRVVAREALRARRSKYTLTAPGKSGGWYWFSQLWIRTDVPEGGY